MKIEKTNNFISNTQNTHGQCHSQVGFRELLERVKLQVEFECFSVRDKALAEELCCIIAEICALPKSAPVQIEGIKRNAGMVAEVYEVLTGDHIQHVIDKFKKTTDIITHKKSYLRTLLYNSLFEYVSEVVNVT